MTSKEEKLKIINAAIAIIKIAVAIASLIVVIIEARDRADREA